MTLEEKVGRVFLFTLRSLPHAENLLRFSPAGFVRVYTDALTASRQHSRLRSASRFPILIAADFERGVAPVVAGATEFGPAMALAAAGDVGLTQRVACTIAREARAIGVDFNLMPTADVNTDPLNPIISTRAFADNPATVAAHADAFIRGTHEGGCLTCAKHFPGHGATHADSHGELPQVDVSVREFSDIHLEPFRAAIRAGVDAVMVGHLNCPALDPSGTPATLSPRIIDGILRREMGFDGVVMSDALDMGALTHRFATDEIVVRSLMAGCDLLIMPADPFEAYHALLGAVQRGDVPTERVEEAAARVLCLALAAENGPGSTPLSLDVVGSADHERCALELARQSITLVRDDGRLLPIAAETATSVVTLCNAPEGLSEYLDPKVFGDYCWARGNRVVATHCGHLGVERYDRPGIVDTVLRRCAQADVTIVGIFARIVVASGRLGLREPEQAFLDQVRRVARRTVTVIFGPPYLATELPSTGTLVCAYGSSPGLQKAAAELIFGEQTFRGKLPIALPPLQHE
jgi:beta-N-acetylhexosaminidase